MMSIGTCATLACLWEATAPKPGNVYRGADFEDLTYADFVTSAAVIGPILERAAEQSVGETILEGVRVTREAVDTNTNLGILLLVAPLAAVPRTTALAAGIRSVLSALTAEDTRMVYQAIPLAMPGGLGEVEEADVNAEPPDLPLVEAMRLAAERDLVARQYVNDFEQVCLCAEHLVRAHEELGNLSDAIVRCHVQMLAEFPDSLVARKCGDEMAAEVSQRAAAVLADEDYQQRLADFDFWLRADGHRRNPGTTADLLAAALFVLLREERLDWPVRFYSP